MGKLTQEQVAFIRDMMLGKGMPIVRIPVYPEGSPYRFEGEILEFRREEWRDLEGFTFYKARDQYGRELYLGPRFAKTPALHRST